MLKISAGKGKPYTVVKDGVNITATSLTKVSITAHGWLLVFTRRSLYKPLHGSQRNYIDIAVRRLSTDHLEGQPVHGVIGQVRTRDLMHVCARLYALSRACASLQSFDAGHRIHADGKLDDYSVAEVTTTAQGEGAIEGVYTDYMMPSPYATEFKFSRFDAALPTVASSGKKAVPAVGFTETEEAAAQGE